MLKAITSNLMDDYDIGPLKWKVKEASSERNIQIRICQVNNRSDSKKCFEVNGWKWKYIDITKMKRSKQQWISD